ncbi:MAG: aminotransferase class IV [Chloroflexota bacterium]
MSRAHINNVQLFAVTPSGPQVLPVPPTATSFDDLYGGLALGVYSALRTFAHEKFLYLQEHIDRTKRSMVLLGWQFELDETLLRQTLHMVCAAYPESEMRVRFDVLAEPAAALGTDSRVLVALMPFTPPPPIMYEQGVAVSVTRELVRRQPLVKNADFALRRRQHSPGAGVYETILLSENGRLLEGATTNFYAVKNGVVYTAGDGVLEGITRRIVLELLPGLNIPVRLEAVTLADAPTLDEAFLSGSSRAVLPVVRIGETPVGSGFPGPVGRRLLIAYNDFVARTIRLAVKGD